MPSAQGIRAGAAYVELYARDNKLVRGLDAAARKLKAFGAGIMSIGARIAGLGATMLLPLLGAAKVFADMGSELADMSQRTGLSVEALSELGFAAKLSGADVETLEAGIRKMQKFLVEAANGSQEARDALEKLGLTIDDLAGLGPEAQFKLIADKLSRIENPALRAALALDVFGKSGTKLLPMMADGAAGLEAMQEKARRLGLTISTEDAQAADEFGDTLDILWMVIKRGIFSVGAALVPALMDLATWITTTTRDVSAWIDQNRELVTSIAQITAVVVGVGVALVLFGAMVSLAGMALSGLVTVIGAVGSAIGILGTALAALLSPIGLIAAALIGLGVLFATQTEAGQAMTDSLKAGFVSFAETAKTSWAGIVAAIQAGDIGLAARIALLGISLEWAKAVLWWTNKWNWFKSLFVDGWRDLVAGVKLIFWDFTAWIARTFAFAIEKLVRATAWVAEKIGLDDWAKKLRENFDFSDENINRNRDRIKNEILNERLAKQREADAARQADAAGAMADVDRIAQELRDAVAEAARKKEAVGERAVKKAKTGSMSDELNVADIAKRKVDIQGTFNALAVQGLGGETLNARTAKAVEQINDNVKKLVAEAQHGGLVFA